MTNQENHGQVVVRDKWELVLDHQGHALEIAYYGEKADPDSVTLECMDCSCVLHDFREEDQIADREEIDPVPEVKITHQTKADARAQIMLGQFGCLAENPSDEYLQALRQDLYKWIEVVDAAIQAKALRDAPKESDQLSRQEALMEMVDICKDNGGVLSSNVEDGTLYFFPTAAARNAARVSILSMLDENDWSENCLTTVSKGEQIGLLLHQP